MFSPIDPTNPASTERELDVRGAVPVGLSGRLVGLGSDGVVHSFCIHSGRVTYAARTLSRMRLSKMSSLSKAPSSCMAKTARSSS